MANEVQTPPEPNMTALVTGIINDAQELFKQQLALVRAEIRSDFQKTKEATLSLAVGGGVAALGGILLCLMLVHLLHWLTVPAGAPGADPARLPLWACYLIVGGAFGILGGVLIYLGVRKFQSFNPLPDQSVEGLRENLQWQTNPTNPTNPR